MTGNTDIPRARAAEAGTFWTREVERGALGLEQLYLWLRLWQETLRQHWLEFFWQPWHESQHHNGRNLLGTHDGKLSNFSCYETELWNIAGSGQQQKPSGLNKKLWDQGSSERVPCRVNSMVPLIRFCLTSAGSGAGTFLESFRVISEAALTLSLGPRWLINWALSPCEWQELVGQAWQGALGSSRWLHF